MSEHGSRAIQRASHVSLCGCVCWSGVLQYTVGLSCQSFACTRRSLRWRRWGWRVAPSMSASTARGLHETPFMRASKCAQIGTLILSACGSSLTDVLAVVWRLLCQRYQLVRIPGAYIPVNVRGSVLHCVTQCRCVKAHAKFVLFLRWLPSGTRSAEGSGALSLSGYDSDVSRLYVLNHDSIRRYYWMHFATL